MNNKVPSNLKWMFDRDLVQDHTSLDTLSKKFSSKAKAYVGFDATKPSLQLGNMVTLNIADLLIEKGIEVYIVLGGATTLIGDPSGKNSEREVVSKEYVKDNVVSIKKYINKYFPKLKVINNLTWWKDYKVIDYLRLSKTIGINYLLDRHLIRERLQSNGISYTEFSYTIIQGIDFYHLAKNEKITVQFGGSDQWGNLLTGHDLINKELNMQTACFSTPLLVDKQNKKFGKTAGNALFLDEEQTSNYELYQNLINQPDDMVEKLLKKLTLLSLEKINEIIIEHNKDRTNRIGQINITENVMNRTRGDNAFTEARRVSKLLFGNFFSDLSLEDFIDLEKAPVFKKIDSTDKKIDEVILETNLASSLSDARRQIKSNGIKVNNDIVSSCDTLVEEYKLYYEKYLIIKKGKRAFVVVKTI